MANTSKAVRQSSKRPVRRRQTNDVQETLGRLMGDRSRLERLLSLEKQRRGIPTDALVFVGIRNLALHWWCTQQAVLKSRADEVTFFAACLKDRIEYAYRLGLVENLPRLDEEVLDVGREITLSNVEEFRESEQRVLSSGHEQALIVSDVVMAYTEGVDKDGSRTRCINPDLPPAEKGRLEKEAAAHGIRVINDPMRRGDILEAHEQKSTLISGGISPGENTQWSA